MRIRVFLRVFSFLISPPGTSHFDYEWDSNDVNNARRRRHSFEVQKSMPSVYGAVTGEDDFVRKEAAAGVIEAMQGMKVL